ncbi:hypothetical protein C0Q70_12924 [Pomacea canaliculata]|uniref:Uncharacterized protein n=1 Tax=Pomacea canaliculata TaxID=400727 RepID=A0A2T7P2U5_POMCA|nr:uncharacterized protein LOC112569154 [Pomacea canaliculata]PVD27752.1 hypothetical protein C0Q70_12924 [Pomacea canaliculata]
MRKRTTTSATTTRRLRTSPISGNLKLDCFAEPPLCEGLDARFCYNKVYNKGDNKGELFIRVIIAHLQCGHRGKWTCQVTPPSAHATAKAKTIQVVGFTRPSDVKIKADGVSDTGFLIAMSGTTISFTCEGNVGSPNGHFYFATKQHLVTSELNEEDLYNATEETEAEDKECIWTRTGILEHQLSDVDDHKSFKCGVRCEKCEHEILFPHSIITVFIVNLNGTTWHSLNPLVTGGITDPLAPSNASSAAATLSECTNDVWVIFGVAAGGIIALVIIIESIFYLRKKIKSLSWYSF